MIMPKAMQIYKMKQDLLKMDISPDTVDLESLVDGRISYSENLTNIERKIGRSHKLKQKGKYGKSKHKQILSVYDAQELSFEREQALSRHMRRSSKSIQMDERKRAHTILKDKDILNYPSKIAKWYKNPNRLDIKGIDD